jgi:hypothetical protein
MKILLAVDGSAGSDAAADAVAGRPWPAGSRVKVVSAVKLPFTPTDETRSLPESYYSQLEKSGREKAQEAIVRGRAASAAAHSINLLPGGGNTEHGQREGEISAVRLLPADSRE